MEYAYVKLVNDTDNLAVKALEVRKRKAEARKECRQLAIDKIGCDEILYDNREGIYLGFKEKPETESQWWRKNQVDRHDGYYVLHPKVNTEQGKLLDSVRKKYKEMLGDSLDVSEMVCAKYDNLVSGICGSNPYGGGFIIASPAFAVTVGEDPEIIGKLPFNKENPAVIPDDFEELTVTQFDSYFSD